MARTRGHKYDEPHIVVTDSIGAMNLGIRTGPGAITVAPITGQNQVVTVGDTAQRTDQRTPQVIATNQQGGGSQFWYTETEGVETYTDSECDARYAGMITLPPAGTQLGGTIASFDFPWIEFPLVIKPTFDSTGQPYFLYQNGGNGISARLYDIATSSWVVITSGGSPIVNTTGYCRFRGYQIVVTFSPNGLYYNTFGTTFTNVARAKNLRGCCVHDSKLFVFNSTDSTLDWHTDPTSATGWASSSKLYLDYAEYVSSIGEWRDASGRTVIYLYTSQRILWYDEDADVFMTFSRYARNVPILPAPEVWERDGNLYVGTTGYYSEVAADTIAWFSGTRNITGPNRFQGLPSGLRTRIQHLAGGLYWLYAFASRVYNGAGAGRVWWLNDQQGMGAIVSPPTGYEVRGGGYVDDTLIVAYQQTGTANVVTYRYSVPDSPIAPIFATNRTYDTTTTRYHEYAYTDGGTPNLPKNARWVTVQALRPDTTTKEPGLAAGCQIVVQYQRDTDTSWTTLGTLTSASTFPAVVPFPSTFGTFKQIKLRIGLSSTTASLTPVVTSVALAYLRQEVPRDSVTLVADLAFGDKDFYDGLDRGERWARILSWRQPGTIVSLAFAGGDEANPLPTSSSYPACTVEFGQYHDAHSGPSQITLTFSDVSAPNSG